MKISLDMLLRSSALTSQSVARASRDDERLLAIRTILHCGTMARMRCNVAIGKVSPQSARR